MRSLGLLENRRRLHDRLVLFKELSKTTTLAGTKEEELDRLADPQTMDGVRRVYKLMRNNFMMSVAGKLKENNAIVQNWCDFLIRDQILLASC